MPDLNDPALRSWIDIPPTSDFPIQNLPFGVFETAERGPRLGVAIGGYVLDLYAASQYGFFEDLDLSGRQPKVFRRRSLNAFIRLGPAAWRAVRQRVSELLRHDNPTLRDHQSAMRACLVRQTEVGMRPPVKPRYLVRFAGAAPTAEAGYLAPTGHYAAAAGLLAPASEVATDAAGPAAPPLRAVGAYLGFVNGRTTAAGTVLTPADAADVLFGAVLLLGWPTDADAPFTPAKSRFRLGAWVVPLDALASLRVAGPPQLPEPLPYLRQSGPPHLALQLEVALHPADAPETVLTTAATRQLYWSAAQQLASLTSNGAPLRAADLYVTGPVPTTIPTPDAPLILNDGSPRTALLPGDTLVLRGHGEPGEPVRIGFGEVTVVF